MDLTNNAAAVHDLTCATLQAPINRDPSESLRRKSLVMMIHEARRTSSGPISFTRKLLSVILADTFFVTCVSIGAMLPLTKLFVGSYYLHECRYEPAIPIYLIIGGFLATLRDLWIVCMKWMYSDYDYEMREKRTFTLLVLMGVTETVVFVTGCCLVYVVQPMYSHDDLDTCSPTLYQIAYWLVTITVMVASLLVVVAAMLTGVTSYLDENIMRVVAAETMIPHYQNNIELFKPRTTIESL